MTMCLLELTGDMAYVPQWPQPAHVMTPTTRMRLMKVYNTSHAKHENLAWHTEGAVFQAQYAIRKYDTWQPGGKYCEISDSGKVKDQIKDLILHIIFSQFLLNLYQPKRTLSDS